MLLVALLTVLLTLTTAAFGAVVQAAILAKSQSDEFDSLFGFSCSAAKCQLAYPPELAAGLQVAPLLGYKHGQGLDTLGLHYDLASSTTSLLKFDLAKAQFRLRYVKAVAGSFTQKIFHIRRLVLPSFCWAAGFALLPDHELRTLQKDFKTVFDRRLLKDTPFCVLKEILGWNTLEKLEWWADDCGRYIYRTDTYGSVRRFKVGHDSPSILHEWLCDFHRERELRQCARIRQKFHRDDPQCATGLDLPGPPETGFCLFAGHRVAWASDGSKYLKHAAMASGCSVWYKFPGSSSFDPGDLRWNCRCGLYKPSRVHLVWSCPETVHLRPPHAPLHRVEERLFAKVVQERPSPCAVPHFDSYCDDITAAILKCLDNSPEVIVATDGCADAQASVASWCVALPQIHC